MTDVLRPNLGLPEDVEVIVPLPYKTLRSFQAWREKYPRPVKSKRIRRKPGPRPGATPATIEEQERLAAAIPEDDSGKWFINPGSIPSETEHPVAVDIPEEHHWHLYAPLPWNKVYGYRSPDADWHKRLEALHLA